MKISLTPEEKASLEYRHAKETDKRLCDRIKSILLRHEGWSLKKIAQALRLHNDTIARHIKDYLEEKSLSSNHKGSFSKLSETQTSELTAHLVENLYDKASDVVGYVKENFGVEYSIAGMTDWLKQHQFSYKQPTEQPAKANLEKQKEFISSYEALKKEIAEKNEKDENHSEPILFIDAVHPTMATKIAKAWIHKKLGKIIKTTASRTRMNIIGSIELMTMKVVSNDYDTINSDSVILFLNKVKSEYSKAKKIHIILDQSGYNTSHALKAYAKENGFELHYLPPYSPNLNSIERLWKVMHEEVRNNYYFKTAVEFRDRIKEFFQKTIPEKSLSLGSRINDNFHIIIPAA